MTFLAGKYQRFDIEGIYPIRLVVNEDNVPILRFKFISESVGGDSSPLRPSKGREHRMSGVFPLMHPIVHLAD